MPILASLDIPVAKISSRGYGVSGGTIDKLESIPGFKTDLTSYFTEKTDEEDLYKTAVDDKIKEILEGIGSTKDIGDLGENLVIGHEKSRLIITMWARIRISMI